MITTTLLASGDEDTLQIFYRCCLLMRSNNATFTLEQMSKETKEDDEVSRPHGGRCW